MPIRHRFAICALGVWSLAAASGCAGVRPVAATGGGGGQGAGGTPTQGADARPERCDAAGNCACMNIASLGKVAHYGANTDSTDAFQQYLNTKSNARVTLFTQRVTLTPDLLASYDVIVLQALEDSEYAGFWTYGQDEVDALAEWVKAGNALIALTGYGGNPQEVEATNQLLSFAGITYGKTDTFTSCPDGTCYCTDSSIPFHGWTEGGFLGAHVTARDGGPGAVGLLHGRPITCADGADGRCQVVASDPQASIVGVAKQVGDGRVFVWSDEWVTYTSQWGAVNTHGPDCVGHTAGEIYDVPQFWFNVIHWLLPNAACFHIDDPIIVG